MLRLDRITVYLIIAGFITMIPAVQYLTSIDEFLSELFLVVGVFDCIANNRWKDYTFLWTLLGLMIFYFIYSFTFVHFNTPRAIVFDFIVELKPYVPVAVILAIKPKFNDIDRKFIKGIALFNSVLLAIALVLGDTVTAAIVFHPTYSGIIILISALFYLYCCIDENGEVSHRDLRLVFIIISSGLLCLRAKYYGIYIFVVFFFFLYKPGIMRHFNLKHAIGLIALFIIVLAVSWHKIQYYFIMGENETFDPTQIESFARPVLYITGFQILFDYFPFGTGLASFATAGSALDYSNVYYEYGIDKVHGLAPNLDFNFICDTFFPVLAQFGVVGVILFTYFWVWIYEYLRIMIRRNASRYRYEFIIGSIIILFIMIESIASATLTGNCGFVVMILLGLVCIPGIRLKQQKNDIAETSYGIPIKIGQSIRSKKIKI